MKMRRMQLIAPLIVFGMNLLLFQNCSKVAVSDHANPEEKVEVVATATNDHGDPVPVEVEDTADAHDDVVVTPPPTTTVTDTDDSETHDDTADTSDDHSTCKERKRRVASLSEACGMDLKTIHKVIDLAQFEGQDVSLDLLKGKVLVYSSNPEIKVSSLHIKTAVGRTILCGARVDQLDVKKGRLEVYQSEILSIQGPLKNIIRDTASILPAGY